MEYLIYAVIAFFIIYSMVSAAKSRSRRSSDGVHHSGSDRGGHGHNCGCRHHSSSDSGGGDGGGGGGGGGGGD